MTALQDWNPAFPVWPPVKLTKYCPSIDEAGLDLLEVGDCPGPTAVFDACTKEELGPEGLWCARCLFHAVVFWIWNASQVCLFSTLSHPHYFFTHPLEQKLVVLDPKSRISAKTALYHRYFDDLDKQQFRQ